MIKHLACRRRIRDGTSIHENTTLNDEQVWQQSFSIGGTANLFRAVRSGVQGHPMGTTQPRLHLACTNLFIFYGTYLERPSGNRAGKWLLVIIPTITGQGSSAGAGLGRAWAVARGGGANWTGAAIASGFPRAWEAERERSASTDTMRLQFGKLFMWVSDCNGKCARQQFICNCRARARVEMVIILSRGQNAK
eukprot:3567289-Pleurochrysis_carterae.AAC.2